MGPLAQELIGSELNLIAALLIGVAFGFVLEQAGFSSSMNLAHLFYGRNFVVLRVFFTAALTATMGIIILSHFGLINLDLIYINPTYVKSAIIGGIIMGLGFIIGGFCPGTSVCAMATGKIDAMFFVLGTFIGVFFFAEAYDMFHSILTANYLGSPLIYNSLGMSKGIFVFLLLIVAMGAFLVSEIIERKINKQPKFEFTTLRKISVVCVAALVFGFSMNFIPDAKSSALSYLEDGKWKKFEHEIETYHMEALVYRLVEKNNHLVLVDLRSKEDFEKSHLPYALNIPLDKLGDGGWRELLRPKNKDLIFYGVDQNEAIQAAVVSQRLGDKKAKILNATFDEFEKAYLSNEPLDNSITEDLAEFRVRARVELAKQLEEEKSGPVIVVKKKKIQGGC